MGKDILKLEPKAIWKIFYELTQIPRPSKNEGKIQAFAVEFGEKLGLDTMADEVGNVIIRKPATKGMENRKGVVLQAHLDMVPQKNNSSQHDFDKDPIDAYVDGGWVKAKGTTLGSDNGIGASAALAILESKDVAHGPVEVLLTCDEETGMTGANGIKPGILHGDILLNLDSEDEGELYIGCAGGVNTSAVFTFSKTEVPPYHEPYRISITGLKGGHSGLDINLGRGNANKIMILLLTEAASKFGVRLAQIEGGNVRNAIPRECFSVVVVPENKKSAFKEYVAGFELNAKTMYEKADPGLLISVNQTKMPRFLIDEKTQKNLYHAVAECPDGVIAMSREVEGIVETSTNLAILKSGDNTIEMASLQRSSVNAARDKIAKDISDIFKAAGAKAEISGTYPGWKPNVDSAILKTMKHVYLNKFGKVPEVKVIHAGLECGILGAKYPNWDMVSFGPTIRSPHSPDERVNIPTVGLF
jgi:dipeptidase D